MARWPEDGRWRGGRACYYPPIDAHPVAISPRYLSEDERVLIGDLLRAGHSVRSVATVLGRSPSTVSREIRRNVSEAATATRGLLEALRHHARDAKHPLTVTLTKLRCHRNPTPRNLPGPWVAV